MTKSFQKKQLQKLLRTVKHARTYECVEFETTHRLFRERTRSFRATKLPEGSWGVWEIGFPHSTRLTTEELLKEIEGKAE